MCSFGLSPNLWSESEFNAQRSKQMTTKTARTTTNFWEAFDGSPITVAELANRTGTSTETAAEWLAQQASEDFLTFDATASRYANFCSWPRAA
jgi:hypothetical protein